MDGIFTFISVVGDSVIFILKKLFGAVKTPFVFLFRFLFRLLCRITGKVVSWFAPEGTDGKEYASSVRNGFVRGLSSPSYAFSRIKSRISSYRFTVRKAVLWLMPAVAAVLLAVIVSALSSGRPALKIICGDEVIGYAANEKEYLTARENAEEILRLGGKDYEGQLPDVSFRLEFTGIDRLSDVQFVAEELLERSGAGLTPACGVYIDGEFFCAVKNEEDAREAFENDLGAERAKEPDAIVSYVEDISFAEGLYPDNEKCIISKEQLENKLRVLNDAGNNYLTVKTVKTVVRDEIVPKEIIEIDSDTLYTGTMRILSEGEDGIDQITALATYINGVRTDTEDIYRLTVKEPSARRLQVGRRVQKGSYQTVISSYTTIPAAYSGGKMVWPVAGAYNINSDYGYRWGKLHAGLDIGMGSAPGTSLGKTVIAAADGVVTLATTHSSYGYYIIIDHGGGVQTVYGHLYAGSFMVSPGQAVTKGQAIARVGSTGYATGPHLHFEVRVNGTRVDPKPFLGIS